MDTRRWSSRETSPSVRSSSSFSDWLSRVAFTRWPSRSSFSWFSREMDSFCRSFSPFRAARVPSFWAISRVRFSFFSS